MHMLPFMPPPQPIEARAFARGCGDVIILVGLDLRRFQLRSLVARQNIPVFLAGTNDPDCEELSGAGVPSSDNSLGSFAKLFARKIRIEV